MRGGHGKAPGRGHQEEGIREETSGKRHQGRGITGEARWRSSGRRRHIGGIKFGLGGFGFDSNFDSASCIEFVYKSVAVENIKFGIPKFKCSLNVCVVKVLFFVKHLILENVHRHKLIAAVP